MALTKTGLTFVNGQAPALNGANMNVIVDLTDDIVDAIETPSYSDEVEETKEIISLNGNARGGTFDATVKGNTWSNSLTNGNFASGTVGWSSIAASSMTVSNKVMSLTGDGTSVSIHASIHTTIPYTTGRKVFTYTRQRVTNSNCTQLALTIANTIGGGGVAVKNITPTINTYYEMYAITTLPSDSTTIRLYLRHSYTDTATANGKVMEVDGNVGVFAIDMTALGLESKTEAEMLDIVRAGYWEGTESTDKSRVKVTGKNLFDKSKAVIGFFVNTTTGELSVSASGNTASDFMKVKPSATYIPSGLNNANGYQRAYYDENKNYISGELTIGSFTTPSNCRYVRYTIRNTDLDTAMLEEGSTATAYEPYTKTQATCPVKLKSVPAIQDEWDCNTGEITKNVENGVLGSELVIDGDMSTPASWTTSNFTISGGVASYNDVAQGFIQQNITITTGKLYKITFDLSNAVNAYVLLATNAGSTLGSGIGASYQAGLTDGSYTFYMKATTTVTAFRLYSITTGSTFDLDNLSIKEIDTSDGEVVTTPSSTNVGLGDGGTYNYQLAIPQTIYTQPAILNAEPNGTVYVEPYIAEDETAQFYSSGLVLDSNYPLSSLNDIDEINKYNLVDGTITPVDISDLTLASSTLITSVSATDGEFYALSYNYKNLSTIGTVKHNHGLNIKAQANDATEGLKLLDKKINDTKINIEQLNDKIEDLYINQIYGTRW